jgi:hypothetical protein
MAAKVRYFYREVACETEVSEQLYWICPIDKTDKTLWFSEASLMEIAAMCGNFRHFYIEAGLETEGFANNSITPPLS